MILAITRSKVFSPNMSDKDLAIMRAVTSRLESQGYKVRLVDEIEWVDENHEILPDAIFTMLRSQVALKKLKSMEEKGVKVVNASQGIQNAERWKMTTLLRDHHLPVPASIVIPDEPMENISTPCWVKQGQGWAQEKDDVAFVTNHQQLQEHIHRLMDKYPEGNVVVTEHLKGDLVKFYGVEGTDFFYWTYPDPASSKFGLEQINGRPEQTPFDTSDLKKVCDKAAKLSKIIVYGGDCIINEDGSFKIIDFNDWPSFSICREEAASAIATRLIQEVEHRN